MLDQLSRIIQELSLASPSVYPINKRRVHIGKILINSFLTLDIDRNREIMHQNQLLLKRIDEIK